MSVAGCCWGRQVDLGLVRSLLSFSCLHLDSILGVASGFLNPNPLGEYIPHLALSRNPDTDEVNLLR